MMQNLLHKALEAHMYENTVFFPHFSPGCTAAGYLRTRGFLKGLGVMKRDESGIETSERKEGKRNSPTAQWKEFSNSSSAVILLFRTRHIHTWMANELSGVEWS